MVNKWLIVNTLKGDDIVTRTFVGLRVDVNTICTGNNSVTARCYIGDNGDALLMKCYLMGDEYSKRLYGSMYYERELAIFSPSGDVEYIDVALSRWIDGVALSECMADSSRDFFDLSHNFDYLAYNLLTDKMVHCDIKPENIIVSDDGTMSLIDYDALWSESLDMGDRHEYGTSGYRDVTTTEFTPPAYMRNYPLVLISVILAALALDYSAMYKYVDQDAMLDVSKKRSFSAAMKCANDIFLRHADYAHLALLNCITPSGVNIDGLADKMYKATYSRSPVVAEGLGPYFDV